MYQNNYTNITEQYINIIRNGPDESTVIRGYHVNGVDGMLEIWIKPKIIIGIDAKEVNKMRLAIGNYIVVPSTKITEDFGGKWIPTFKKLFPEWY